MTIPNFAHLKGKTIVYVIIDQFIVEKALKMNTCRVRFLTRVG